ncbi:GtrA family protein [Halarcobacter sp.]|uniref:GtrA family protein n=1 Tax=Halarcobacter sp. TaxID=2321133 RepID=UPI0029F5BBA3|nr:GtrA family protein [Halarcobacter sp.]
MKQFIKFGIVGSIGFCIDAIILLLCVNIFEIEVYIARVLSFSLAVFTTWLLNRVFTFQKSKYGKKREYFYYFTIQSIGAILNYIIFIMLVKNNIFFEQYLVFALAVASFIAMFFNFILLQKKVFI